MEGHAGQVLATRRSFGEQRARQDTERAILRYRTAALVAGVGQTFLLDIPDPGVLVAGVALLAATSAISALVLRRDPSATALGRLGVAGMVLDVVVAVLVMASSTADPADPVQMVTLFLAAEGAVRWGRAGGVGLGVLAGAMGAGWTVAAHASSGVPLQPGYVTFRVVVVVIVGALLGSTVDAVRRQRRLADTVCNASRDLIATFDLHGTIQSVNPASEELLGYRPEELVGTDRAALIAPGHRPEGAPDQERLRADGSLLVELPFVRRDGHTVWLELDLQPDWEEGLVYAIGRDVSARRRAEDDLRHRAHHDSLTGAANRSLLVARIDRALARRRAVALLFVDLDGFKGVNDGHGHGAGDQVLVGVVDRLRAVVRQGDLVARLAGDEFCVLLDDPSAADEIARRVCEVVAEPFLLDGGPVALTASVGLATSRDHDTAIDLLDRADAAMYEQKRAARQRAEAPA